MLPSLDKPTLATHWGTYRVHLEEGVPVSLASYEGDPDPSPIASAMIAARTSPARVLRPAVRRSFLNNGATAGGGGRGAEPFVEVGWDDALGLVAESRLRLIANIDVSPGRHGRILAPAILVEYRARLIEPRERGPDIAVGVDRGLLDFLQDRVIELTPPLRGVRLLRKERGVPATERRPLQRGRRRRRVHGAPGQLRSRDDDNDKLSHD